MVVVEPVAAPHIFLAAALFKLESLVVSPKILKFPRFASRSIVKIGSTLLVFERKVVPRLAIFRQ